MKGGVEDRHVPGPRQHGTGRTVTLQVHGIVQRSQFVQPLDFQGRRVVQFHRRRELLTAMHHAVADGFNLLLFEPFINASTAD